MINNNRNGSSRKRTRVFVTAGVLGLIGLGILIGDVTKTLPAWAATFGGTIITDRLGVLQANVDASHRLSISCDNGCTAGAASTVDEASFTQGASTFTPVGGLYATSITNLTAGQTGVARLTNDRKLLVSIPDALPTGTNLVGHVNVDAQTGNGASKYHLSGGTAASTNSASIKGSAGNLLAMVALNTTTTVYYLKLYDSSSAPTCSSASGIAHVYPIPPAAAAGGVGGFVVPIPVAGEGYSSGIGFCVTGGGSDTDNTNAATGVFIEASYK